MKFLRYHLCSNQSLYKPLFMRKCFFTYYSRILCRFRENWNPLVLIYTLFLICIAPYVFATTINDESAIFVPAIITESNHVTQAPPPHQTVVESGTLTTHNESGTTPTININESAHSQRPNNNITESMAVLNISDSSSESTIITAPQKTNQIDPYENFNRNSFRMNQTLDKHFVRPATVWYITYIPGPIRSGVQNFFNNLRDFVTLGNDILQLSTYRSAKDTARVCINSTIGILGLIDVSSHIGLPEHINTFGKTMRFYGWEHSSYYMIPLLGPSTIRDALGLIPDMIFNPTWFFNYPYSNYVSVSLFVVNGLDQRSKFLDFDQSLNTSIDPYATVRDFYLQSSGNLPEEPESGSDEVKLDSLLDN